MRLVSSGSYFFFFQAEDGIRDATVTGVQTCALPIFQVGAFLITWHGIFSVLGILAAARLGAYVLEQDGVTSQQVYDMAVWMVVVGIIGARLLYVWENYHQCTGQPFYKVFALNEGGISQWSGIFGALLGGWLWCLRNHVPFLRVVDAAG